ncbi:hypothetical protein ACFR9U_04645, partial [Halorientalis brevis]
GPARSASGRSRPGMVGREGREARLEGGPRKRTGTARERGRGVWPPERGEPSRHTDHPHLSTPRPTHVLAD